MNIYDYIHNGIFLLDGATGSMLQSQGIAPGEFPETWNVKHPEKIVKLHKAYYQAGSHAVVTNTFGANGLKFKDKQGSFYVAEIVKTAVLCAKKLQLQPVVDKRKSLLPWISVL